MFDLTTEPYYWNSPYHPVTFEWDYETKSVSGKTDIGGYVQFNLSTGFTTTPVVGQKVIVENTSSLYYGIHVITNVSGVGDVDITTSTPYVVDATGISLKFMEIYEIELYKGYDAGDTHLPGGFDSQLPLTLVATFTPENSASNNVSIDISGYLQNIFGEIDIQTLGVSGYEYTMFNRFRLKFNGVYQDYYHVCRTGIDTESLGIYFLDTGKYLIRGVPNDVKQRYEFSNFYTFGEDIDVATQYLRVSPTCNNFLSYLTNNGVVAIITDGNTLQNP